MLEEIQEKTRLQKCFPRLALAVDQLYTAYPRVCFYCLLPMQPHLVAGDNPCHRELPSEPSEPYSPGKDSLCFRVRALLSMQWVERTSVTRQHKLLHLKHIPTQNDYVMLQHDYGQDLHVQQDSPKMRKETENHCCC